ncbi:hypothetical protein ALI22I_10895 [Saccharothrix sp. ALI-22-I]|uniref:hypothetical protein n=1 Tax=Saccharothrix sp. ALI-22-I TaxID=1933778 RepID=UPI00097C9A27|nr:hypothetical protein [Saccharothrix sp. ALI-22-I]ONI90930.1 hypothetical protein ALI22I_10895 [Saccharothrix sp. ALI-22-I]
MDLTAWLLRRTPPRPFVVATPGGTLARFAVERVVRERGWWAATSPAEANMLVVAGPPAPGLDTHIDRVWDAMPAPRVRTHVRAAAEASAVLVAAVAQLHDRVRQQGETKRRAVEPDEQVHEMSCGSAMPDMDHGGHDQHQSHGDHHEHENHQEHNGHEHHDEHQQHGGHEPDSGPEHNNPGHDGNHGHDMHHGHDMSGMEMPGGIPLADRAADRDGLMLDVLRVPLGPALPDWPAGLVVHTVLQGDVVQEARIELLGHSGHHAAWRDEVVDPALVHRLDSAARLLAIAGWQDASTTARRLRDEALVGSRMPGLDRWTRQVRRSRTLRWSLAGVGEYEGTDALDRLRHWLDGHGEPLPPELLPDLLVGTELAAARLIVAGLGLDLDQRVHTHG